MRTYPFVSSQGVSKSSRTISSSLSVPSYYRDLREYLTALDQAGKLIKVTRPTSIETELTSLVRLQFRGLPEEKRCGFLFDNVTSVTGRKFNAKVATGVYSSSLQIYGLGLKCEPNREAIQKRWTEGQLHPIEPKLVSSGPVHENVCMGSDLLKDGQGIESLPVPVELPGFSGQIRTSTQFISRDPTTGIRNMGNYSGHIFGKTKILWEINPANHGKIHLKLWKELGKPMPAALIVGAQPSIFYVASGKIPYGVDELAVAGGIAGEPLELVKCKTIDLEVPAHAEIVIEGLVSTEYMEPGNAFGEYTGYMACDVMDRPLFQVTCVTYRNNPIFTHVMSQFPPSESSKVRQVSSENIYYKFLKYDCRLPGILDVAWHETSQAQWCVIKIKKVNPAHPWQVLECAAGYDSRWGKFFITVDEDIDPRNMDSLIWALGWRVQPARDVKIIQGKMPGLDISAYKPDASHEEKEFPGGVGSSGMLIDATTKFSYPPTSLPAKEYMENALKIWKELNLPPLQLVEPWYGYDLGYWPEEFKRDAEMIVKGQHYKVGERLEKLRHKV